MKLAGIQFNYSLKIYDFDQGDLDLLLGDKVVVETAQGLEVGRVVYINRRKSDSKEEIKPITRKATEGDLVRLDELRELAINYLPDFTDNIKKLGLKMKPISADISIDEKRLTFYFTAESRVDFRDLVREMAARSKKQIRLMQIGSRDVARLMGGYGRCGREVCCKKFLIDLESITLDMAKEQNLSTKSSSKLSGACGRLMCCLAFEIDDKKNIIKEIDRLEKGN
jgi:cell fate regulator YaaT (PSP1 superfamily)